MSGGVDDASDKPDNTGKVVVAVVVDSVASTGADEEGGDAALLKAAETA